MADLEQLLEKTSRTFALSIPLLPQPLRHQVTLAYLLFRIADTFEDAVSWPREARIEALKTFRRMLVHPDPQVARGHVQAWLRRPPHPHPGYVELLSDTPDVLESFAALAPDRREILRTHLERTAAGMAGYVSRTDDAGRLKLADLEDLRRYTYVVAGIVGEMLTELFVAEDAGAAAVASRLRPLARTFGEALQLVNILKDTRDDVAEGRDYLPPSTDRSEVFRLAREDLQGAARYTLALQEAGADEGIVAFCALPLLLARGTLDRVETHGPGAKLTRPEVFGILEALRHRLQEGAPAV